MKTFIVYVTSSDPWEMSEAVHLVNAESKEEAESMVELKESLGGRMEKISSIVEYDTSIKGSVMVQNWVVE